MWHWTPAEPAAQTPLATGLGCAFLARFLRSLDVTVSPEKNPLKKVKKHPLKSFGAGRGMAVLAACSHSVNTTGNCLMTADIRISLPLKHFWLGCS